VDPAALEPFSFDLDDAARQYQVQGWIHVPQGLDRSFFDDVVLETARFKARTEDDLANRRIQGKKSQFLWKLPAELSIESLCAAAAKVAAFAPERTVLAERHVNVYDEAAPEFAPPHKDRSSSRLTVVIGIDVAADSRLMIWPSDHLDENPYPASREWHDSRRPGERSETLLAEVPAVEIDVRAGDVAMFRGAAIYHERYRPANSAVLALKFNGDGLDPLGEDPRTPQLEAASAALLADELRSARHVQLSPRVIGLRTDRYLPSGALHTQARLLDRDIDVALTEREVALVDRVVAERVVDVQELSAAELSDSVELVTVGILLAG